jgi:uncharacterized membrane protein
MTRLPERFEMRRLEALSNTIFGVAMTLLAYDLPKASQFVSVPVWTDLLQAYAQKIVVLMISFIVAGVFWISHHRRLALAPEGSRAIVFLNLLFLMSIIVLPATNGLYGTFRSSGLITVIFGVHLIAIATLNAFLWFLAVKGRDDRWEILATAFFPVVVFLIGTAVAFVAPSVSVFVWYLAFGSPLGGWLAARCQGGASAQPPQVRNPE